MKRFRNLFLVTLLGSFLVMGACSTNLWDELPSQITSFISQYFPGAGVKSYKETNSDFRVNVDNGTTLVFDSDYNWVEIDGNGSRLPEVLIYDQLPPAFFNYLQGINAQNGVYMMMRDQDFYKVTTANTVITYAVATGKITYPSGKTVES